MKENVALHITLGDTAKDDHTPTISSQLQALHGLLSSPPNEEWKQVAENSLPLAVHVESAVSESFRNGG